MAVSRDQFGNASYVAAMACSTSSGVARVNVPIGSALVGEYEVPMVELEEGGVMARMQS
jgi:hypothetical protein